MRALPPKVLRDLRDVIADCKAWSNVHPALADRLLAALDAALKPKRAAAPARKRRTQKKATRKEKVAELRALVVDRANLYCECGCGRCADPDCLEAGELDHFHGGAHKRALESFEGCWLLSSVCHRAKTANLPSRGYWLRAFLRHSERYGYSAEPQRKAQAELDALELQARATT